MATLAELLRQGADRLVNLPTEAQRFVTNPQAFTQLITGKNLMPRETGFAAGATGLPAQEMSVLDPNQAPYMQGYSQGEPIGYAGMAAPFAAPAAVATAKALAPKAGQMAENYMVRQGMIQPLTAYHGTPHTIQGQFDIKKVGTGEGAQAYGHGMYFAENPAVAKEYSKMMPAGGSQPSPKRAIFGQEVEPMTPEYKAAQLVDEMGLVKAKKFVADWSKNPTPDQVEFVQGIQNSLSGITKKSDVKNLGTGNLYKVDIPDADIPNMLLWDKPLSQQPKSVQKALAKIDPDLYSKKGNDYDPQETGQMIYQRLSQMDMNKRGPFTGAAKNVSEMLNTQGIKGIRYNDAGSRTAEGGTSNFVIFEPSTVKILEKNNQPVTRKELIQQQIDKIE
jgi:hypothetical protein